MQRTYDWMLYSSCVMAVLLCYFVRYFQERNRVPKPDSLFQFICSITLSYLAYFLHTDVKAFKVPLTSMKPFTDIHVWLGFISYLAAYLVKQFDAIFKKGWKYWAREFAKQILARTEK